MRREQTLRRKLKSLGVLAEAIAAMKSLSAHHLRAARSELSAARAYQAGIGHAIAAAGLVQIAPREGAPGVLLLAADLGLCDGYSPRLVDAALAQHRTLGAGPLYCVGRRPLLGLRRAQVAVTRVYPAATNVRSVTHLLLAVADDVIDDYLRGAFSSLHVVSAQFDGVGAFTARSTRLLPVVPAHAVPQPAATPYASERHLGGVAIREYLYSTLYELLVDALAAEHGMRLVATQAAEEWLDTRVRDLRRELASARREASTQEVLDIAGGARLRRARHAV